MLCWSCWRIDHSKDSLKAPQLNRRGQLTGKHTCSPIQTWKKTTTNKASILFFTNPHIVPPIYPPQNMAPTIRWNYYAVRRGSQPDSRGVCETWEEATVHCAGEKGKKKVPIKHKGFTRRADADAHVDFANDADADARAKAGAVNNHKGTLDDGQQTPLSSVNSRASSHAASPIAPPLTRAAAAKQGKLPPFK
jgi:hypothetical protein